MSEYTPNTTEVLDEAISQGSDFEAAELVGRLVQANYNHYANTTSRLISNYRNQLADREAELAAIRHRIEDLLCSDYMPSSDAIAKAVFYPSKDLMDSLRINVEEEETP